MELKIASENDRLLWDALVEQSPNGTLFHTWKWLKLMEKYSSMQNYGIKSLLFPHQRRAKLYPILFVEKDSTIGIFPVLFFKHRLLNICYSPPSNMGTTVYLGPLFPDIDTMKQEKQQVLIHDVLNEMDHYIKKTLQSKYVQINTPPGFEDCRAFKWSGYSVEPRYTYYIDLTVGTDVIWKSFNRSLRYYIEKARKNGITVTQGDKDDLFYIYDLLKERNRTPGPKELLGAIFDTFYPDQLKVFIAKTDSRRLSGIIITIYKDRVCFWVGAPRCSYHGLRPNELVLWESMRWAAENGYKIFELIGADDYSLFPYKRKFNGKIIPYYHITWVSPGMRFLSSVYHSFKDLNKDYPHSTD